MQPFISSLWRSITRKAHAAPVFEGDIALLERWLYTPHVAKWYEHPDHWLHELHERRGGFSFLTHFIAEFEGVPIGFCQYYDTFFAQEHEVWHNEPGVGEKQGEMFSIDTLSARQHICVAALAKR